MKKFVLFLAYSWVALFSGSVMAAPELSARWSTDRVVLGESFSLQLSTDVQANPELLGGLPDFLNSHGSSSAMQIVNGQVMSSSQYEFTATRTGEFTIPALEVQIGRERVKTAPWKLKVEEPEKLTLSDRNQTESPIGKLVFGRGCFPGDRTRYYVGEEIPVRLELFIADSVYAQATNFPTLDAGKAIFRQYPDSNNPNFQLTGPKPATADDRTYQCLTFHAMFRALASGQLQPKASIPTVVSPDGRRRAIEYTVDFPLPELVIQPLPPVPAGMSYLGLVGKWSLEVSLSGSPRQAGEALTLTVNASGEGIVSTDTLKAPVLDWPGCRVYPAEVNKSPDGSRAEIRYTFIPLEPGTLTLPVQFAAFNPATGAYEGNATPAPITIEPGKAPAATTETTPAVAPTAAKATESSSHAVNLHYLKLEPRQHSNIGVVITIVFFAFLGPVWYLWVWLLRQRREAATPESIRRQQAGRRRKKVLDMLHRSEPSAFPEVLDRDVLPYLADRYNLPPGLTAGEIADRVPDAELSGLLRNYADLAYAPQRGTDWRPTADQVWRCLKRLGVVALFGLSLTLAAADWQQAVKAYDDGDFAQAQTQFEQLWDGQPEDAALWFNLGCVSAQQGQWARAAWYFEGAELLSPGDNATRENLNQVRRKLLQPAYGQITRPLEFLVYLRDQRRPGNYLALLAIGWSCLWIWWSFRRRWSLNMLWTVTGAIVLVMILAGVAWWTQRCGPYASDRGIVRLNRAPLYSLPSEHNARELLSVPGGTPVRILETRQDFYRVTTPETSGWMSLDAVGKLP